MRIKLYAYSVVAKGLTWAQVLEAETKANESEAGKALRFYKHKFPDEASPIRCWSLLAMPIIYAQAVFGGADDSGWYIEIADA